MKNVNRCFMLLMALLLFAVTAKAQKSCVIANAENHVPLREAIIHTNTNHWARTDYRGYFTMKYPFDSATVSKSGFLKTTIYYETLPDTLFLLPETQQLGTVEVWGKDQEHVRKMEEQTNEAVKNMLQPITGIGFDAFGWMDRQGRRDRKHLKKARRIFAEMEQKKDPIEDAYEKATGKKVIKKPDEASEMEPNSEENEEQP